MSEEEKIRKIQEEIKGYKEKLYQDKNFVAELEENLTEDTWGYISKFNRYNIACNEGYDEEEYYNEDNDIETLKLKLLPSKEWIEENLKGYYSYCVKIISDFGANIDEIDTKAIEKSGIEKCFKLWKLCICKNKHGWKLPDEVAKEHLDECLLISKAMLNFEEIPSIFVEKYPEEYLKMAQETVGEDNEKFKYVDERLIEKYPEEYLKMAQSAVKYESYNLQYIDERIIDKYKEEYLKMAQEVVKEGDNNLEYVDGRIIEKYPEEYLKMAQSAVKYESYNLQYVDVRIIEKYPEEYLKMAQSAVGYESYNLQYVDGRIIDKYPKEYLKMTQDFVGKNVSDFQYVDGRIIEKYPEEYLKMAWKAVEWCVDNFKYVDGRIIEKYPEKYLKMTQSAVKYESYNLQYIDERIIDKYPEEYLRMAQEVVKEGKYNLEYVDVRIIEKYPEEYLKMVQIAVEKNASNLQYVDVRIIDKYPEEYLKMAQEAVKYESYSLEYVDERLIEKYPEEYIKMAQEAIEDYEINFQYVDGRIIKKYPEEYLKMAQCAVEKNVSDFQYVDERIIKKCPEEYLKMVQKCLKTNVNVYKYIDQDVRDSEEVKNMMFENAKAIERIKEKAKFKVNDEIQMDIFYHQMIKSIGLEETEKLVEIPNLSKEEVEKYGLEYDERLNELFDRKYKLKGETGAVIELFKAVDLKEYQEKGKNIQFEVYKNINKILEESDLKNLKMSDVMKISLEKSGIKNADEVVLKMVGKLNTIVGNLSEEKLDKTRNELVALLNDGLTSQQEPVRRIIETKIKESLKEGEGIYNKEEIINKIKEELARTRENGGTYYSPHIINQEEKILQITKDFLENKSVEETLQKSLTQTLKEQKEKIGKGWIRKVLGVPEELSKEEYENLEKKLGIKLESSYIATVKQGIDESKAFELLREKSVPGVVTYLQIESMFSEMKEPYSEKFRKFYSKNKKEILENPKVYRELSRMHNNFESIVNDPYVKKKYERGELSLENYMQILNDRKYENVKPGNERFADVAARAGLGKEKFEHVQEIWKKTKKREGTTIPQVNANNKKYKGRILRADEPLNLFVGNVTTCCQKSGDVGEGSMQHGSTERNGAIFVIEETGTNAVVGQSWVWRNNGRICFDNIEINDDIHKKMSNEDEKEILEIYQEAGEKAIRADKKVMEGLLKEGKISQEVYDEVVLKEVTVGLNTYNDLKEIEYRLEDGRLKEAKEIILPKEEKKIYKGESASGNAWIDSGEKQVILASMEEREKEEIEKRKVKKKEDIEVPVIYENMREIVECKGNKIYREYVEKIKKVEGAVYRKEQQVLQDCDNYDQIAERYEIDPEKMEVSLSRDGDWYVIGEERENEYYIPDMAMVGGTNSQRNEKIKTDTKAATFELAYVMYKKLIEMGEKQKTVRYEATKDTSYINTKRMEEKGLVEILSEENDTFENSDIEMKNVVVRPNVEKLKEEIKKVEKMLKILEERGYQKTKIDFDSVER